MFRKCRLQKRVGRTIFEIIAKMEEKERSVEQLLLDEQFLAWYNADDAQAVASWEAKMQADPELLQLSAEARLFLNQIYIQEKGLPAEQTAAAQQKFQEQLEAARPAQVRRFSWFRVAAAAALVLVLAAVGWWRWQAGSSLEEYKIAFGETRDFVLPDGTRLKANANSSIKFAEKFDEARREVWVEGEAFLDVQHLANHTPFVVHTSGYEVHVKGTRFNVLARGDRQQVLLAEGAVELKINGSEATETMKPGDWYLITNNGIEKKQSDGRAILAWTDQQLIFEKTALAEVAQRIQDHYGIAVSVDPALETKEVSGIFPNNDLRILLETLGSSRDFDVQQGTDGLRFTKK